MTAEEYREYEERVAQFWSDHEGLQNLSTCISGENGEDHDQTIEPYFSWRACCVCKRSQGGDRYDCNGYNAETEEVEEFFGVCSDCVYYAEYGQLDDMTMLAVEKDQQRIDRERKEQERDEVNAVIAQCRGVDEMTLPIAYSDKPELGFRPTIDPASIWYTD